MNVNKTHFILQAKLLGLPTDFIKKYTSDKGLEWRSIGSSVKQLNLVDRVVAKAEETGNWSSPVSRKMGLDSCLKTFTSKNGLYTLTVERYKAIITTVNRAVITITENKK